MAYLAVFTAVIAGGFIAYIVAPFFYMQWLQYKQTQQVEGNSCVVLTIDDGPGHRLTPAILDLLDEYGARATFFILGRNVPEREHLLRSVAHRGHEIGTHTHDHLHSWKVSPIRAVADIRRGQREIAQALKTNDVLPFRPPCGKMNLFTLLFCLLKRVPICTWTLDSRDTWPTAQRDSDIIDAQLHSSEGAILLAHDFDRHNASVDGYVLGTLRSTLEYARQHSLRMCTMTEAMAMPSPETSTSTLGILHQCWHAAQMKLWARLKSSLVAKWSLWHSGSASNTVKFPQASVPPTFRLGIEHGAASSHSEPNHRHNSGANGAS